LDNGYIYILSNPGMPGLLKIGFTKKAVEERVNELSNNTGVPAQFEIEAYFDSENAEKAEEKCHESLKEYRVSYKEFFKIEPHKAINIISGVLSKKPIFKKMDGDLDHGLEGNKKYHQIVSQYKRQIKTGYKTEKMVKEKLESFGLIAVKPKHDTGVDLEVYRPENPEKIVKIQVKGRNIQRTSDWNRWFQVRVNKKQRKRAEEAGVPATDAYKEKIRKCEFFVLVSVKQDEMWVFSQKEIFELIESNKTVYGNRPDNVRGEQKEMNLDIEVDGILLTDRYHENLNNFKPILEDLDLTMGIV